MDDASKIYLVNAAALSFSGTTWTNLMLASNPEALAIGPPTRMWNMREEGLKGACRIHPKHCDFWAGFDEVWDRSENLLVALNRYSGKRVFLMDNAGTEFLNATTNHDGVKLVRVLYLRDVRAITSSYWRKNPDKSYIETIAPGGWIYGFLQHFPAAGSLEAYDAVLRYEDMVQAPFPELKKVYDVLSISCTEDALRFWEWDHHITAGNGGPVTMVRLHQGQKLSAKNAAVELYREQLERMKNQSGQQFNDERWKSELSREHLFYFDRLLGDRNELLGYSRDTFTDDEMAQFTQSYEAYMRDPA